MEFEKSPIGIRAHARKEYVVDGMTYIVRFMGEVRKANALYDRWELLLKIGKQNGAKQEAWQDFPYLTHIDVVAGRLGVGPSVTHCECGDIVLDRLWDKHNCYVRRGEDHEADMME